MKQNIILSSGRTIGHKPYLINGMPNGVIEAFVIGGGEMTHEEWSEYCILTMLKQKTPETA